MSSVERYSKNPNKLTSKILATALGAGVLAAVGVQAVENNRGPEEPTLNGPRREYVVKLGDTEAGILQRAYPDQDWRAITGIIDEQLPAPDRIQHLLKPGEVLIFGSDAEVGKLIDPSSEGTGGSVAKG